MNVKRMQCAITLHTFCMCVLYIQIKSSLDIKATRRKPVIANRDTNPFYMEYMVESVNPDGENQYSLHLSYPTQKEAEIFFHKMFHEWLLPVEIKCNRIIILPKDLSRKERPFEGVDIYVGGQGEKTVRVLFKLREHAKAFCEIVNSNNIPAKAIGII